MQISRRRALTSSTMFSAGSIAAALLLAPAAQAQTWSGGDGNWTDPAQWTPSVPAPADDVAIPDGIATIDGTAVTVHDIALYGNASAIAGINVVNGGSLVANYMLLPDIGGFAQLAVSGTGSSVQLSRIGNRGNGESRIQVTQGGTLSVSAGIVSLDPQPAISVLVEDAGSVLDFGTVLQMGGTGGGGGSVVVDNGGRLVGGKIELYANSGVDIGTGTSYALGAIEGHGTSSVDAFNIDTVTLGADLGEADSGRLSVTMNGAGTLRLTGNNSYSGATSIVRGTLAALGAGQDSIGDQSSVVIAAGASLSLTSGVPGGVAGAEDDDETIASLFGSGSVALGDRQLTVADDSQSSQYAGVISGTGSVRKTGAATLRLDAGNSYSGGTFIDGGVVELGANQAIGTGLLALGGGTLRTNGFQQTVTTLSGSAASQIALGTGAVLTTNSGADSMYAGTMLGGGTLVKQGMGALTLAGALSGTMGLRLAAGGLTLAGANSFSGDTHIGGTSVLTLAGDSALGSGRLLVDDGTPELQALGTRVLANAMVMDRADASLVVSGSDTLRLNGAIQASGTGTLGNLIKRGAGTLILGAANTINGVSLEAGTLTLQRMAALGTGPLTVAAGTTLRFDTYGTFDSFAGAVTLAGQANFEATRDLGGVSSFGDFSGSISGAGGFTLTGGGVLDLSGTNSFTGDVIVRQGSLQVEGGNAIADSVAVTLESGGELIMYNEETIGSLAGEGFLNLYLYGLTIGTNNRSTTFAGEIGGSAALRKQGTGTLTLSGGANQNYTGRIEIDNGEVRVDGVLGSSSVNLNSTSARLSGTGIIAGAVNNFGRGTLVGVSGQTLRMSSLNLGAQSVIDVTLGAAGNPALFQVDGALTLAGTVNVRDAGGFGAGVYRLIDYGGPLTLRPVTIGARPTGVAAGDLTLQTSVAGQVNLISSYGLDLLFWDGGNAALYNNGAVDGGNGTWRATGTAWTDADGIANGAMRPVPGFAVFQGAAGTVTTDAGTGALSVTGMQFAVDGYQIDGAGIALAGSGERTVVRVGDGSAAGAGYTATIAAALSGTSDLVKTDLGTLILTGANSYRDTIVEGGTLVGNAASIRGNIANAGTLVFDQASDAAFAGAIAGVDGSDGAMIKRGAGALTLTGASSLDWTIEAGTLSAGAAGFAGDALIAGGATLRLAGGTSSSSSATYAGVLSGTGNFANSGNGTLVLTGQSGAFAGATQVTTGMLQVDGALGGALTVQAGAALAGTGSAGAVAIADGGRLGGLAGTTFSMGSLALASGATLDVVLGSAADPALFAIAGNLALDGTINVAAPSLEGGVYRLISYGGTLTDNGLALGATPAGLSASDLFVQTSVAGQINLVATNGLELTFWDGGNAAAHDNGVIDGGPGTWRADGRNWTDASGAINGPFQPVPSFAVFAGGAGTVTTDASAGTLAVAGMQFAVDGYALQGDGLVLAGANGETVIRVGDGSAAGAGNSATIAAALSGNSALVKTDLGTLRLGGANSYTGDTIVRAGVLSIASDAALGNGGSLVLDGGDLATRSDLVSARAMRIDSGGFDVAQGTQLTLAGSLSGGGDLVKRGLGTLRLDGSSAYGGNTRVEAGILIGDATQLRGALANAGTIVFDQIADATFAGAIAGLGGTGGQMVKSGAGALTLGGASSLDWTIEAGTLIAGEATFSGDAAIADGAGLVFAPAAEALYAGTLSGSGAVAKTGAATLTLGGDSSAFVGAVRVGQGWLDVTGRLGGTLSVENGATLGGTGTLGAVTIADGATLAGASGATLTLAALDLAADARITAALGSPEAAALFAISGDLTLDGTLNISDAGGFGAGIYRLFDYGGTLTDRGLAIGATPGVVAADLLVQTSVAGRVNLVNTDGMTLTFWDGGAGANRDNGRVDGGSGTWLADGRSWTDAAGTTNGRYQPIPSLAVFAGTGGTVTIDDEAGALSVTGLQFAANGYRLEGDTLGLAGADGRTVVRVGDGSAAGAGFTATIAAPLTGNGDLVKTDLGTLILTGANAYSGNTRVEAGTLVGDARSLRGNVAAAGTIVFDQVGDAGFAGTIDGLGGTRGQAVKRGGGVLTLGGTTSLDWRVEAGGLVTRTQAFTGNVELAADGSALTFDQAAAGSYAGRIGGTGTLRVTGGGAIDLSGDSRAFAGSLSVVQGSISVSGTLGGTTSIGAGGVLRGNGTVGSATIGSGGVLAPGNSIGTLTIAGDLTFGPGALYQVEVDPAGTASDRVVVQGHATLAGSVAHIGMAGGYRPTASYTILTAAGGISGSFVGVTSDFAFLAPTLGYTATAVTLTLERNDIDFAAVAATRNQRAAAGAAGTLGSGNAVYDALVVLDAPGARAAFDQLSGELHGSLASQLSQGSRLVREAALGRMRDAAGEPGVSAWAQGLGGWGHIDGDGNAARIEHSAGGAMFGFEAATAQAVRLSAFGGYQRSDVRGGRAGSAKVDTYHVGLGIDAQAGAGSLRAGYAYSWHDIAARRRVAFTGFADDLRADYGASTAQAFAEVSYRVAIGAEGALSPVAGIAHVAIETQAGQEKGGSAALRFGSQSLTTNYTTLGLEAALLPADGRYAIRANIGWQHALGDIVPVATVSLARARFDTAGVPLARDALAAGAEVSMRLGAGWSIDLSYSAALAERSQDHALRGRLKFRF